MPHRFLVAVSATTEMIRGAPRVRLNAAYVRALEGAGLVPLAVPPLAADEDAWRIVERVDGLVLTGGEDVDPAHYGAARDPETGPVVAQRDRTELALAAAARQRGLPTLAICRGLQLVNVAHGGTLVQHIPREHPDALAHAPPSAARADRVHDVTVDAGSMLAAALGAERLRVNSSHHQAIETPGAGLRVTARAPDGIVEGMEGEDPRWWLLGVQWHPEELTETPEPWDRALFAAFASRLGREAYVATTHRAT
jgi:putative glutamine amidotransferase